MGKKWLIMQFEFGRVSDNIIIKKKYGRRNLSEGRRKKRPNILVGEAGRDTNFVSGNNTMENTNNFSDSCHHFKVY